MLQFLIVVLNWLEVMPYETDELLPVIECPAQSMVTFSAWTLKQVPPLDRFAESVMTMFGVPSDWQMLEVSLLFVSGA